MTYRSLKEPYDAPIALKRGDTPAFHWLLDPEQLIDGSVLRSHIWEPYSTWAVESLVRPGMHVLDAGANMGYYTVLLAYLVGPGGHVASFEAMPEPAALIGEHCRLNDIENTVVHCKALGRRAQGPQETFFNYSWPPTRCEQPSAQIATVALDDLQMDRLDFAKVDLDGSELDFIFGARRTLARLRPVLLLEVCDYTLRESAGLARDSNYTYGTKTREMLLLLQDMGYRFVREETFSPVDLEAIIAEDDLSKRSVNVVCEVPT